MHQPATRPASYNREGPEGRGEEGERGREGAPKRASASTKAGKQRQRGPTGKKRSGGERGRGSPRRAPASSEAGEQHREDLEERRRRGERGREEEEKAETPLGSKPPPHPRDKRGATREARRADRGGEEETSPWVTPGPGQMSARRRWSKRSGREWRGVQVVACSAFGLPTVDSGSRGGGKAWRALSARRSC